MQHPYQCVASIRQESQPSFLLTACGSKILSLDLQNHTLVAEWSPNGTAEATTQSNGKNEDNEDGERPAKKQKTNSTSLSKPPNIIRLVVAPTKRYVVAVTDDKSVRVFAQDHGKLTELSQRVMPKRPCAVQITPDDTTILVGDKFGDVYSLPLLPSEESEALFEAQKEAAESESDFKPSATNLTVHSKRNRDALAAQMQQKNFTPRKEALKFEHKLLLGHVSMLTDMKYAQCRDDVQSRGYIITADRDEHIRISRGPPQSHIIEGYCLGHSEFISKICQVGDSNLLISGGGDSWLGLWEWWPEPKLRRKLNMREELMKLFNGSDAKPSIAVSGIWSGQVEIGSGKEEVIVVALEKVKGLLVLDSSSFGEDGKGESSNVCIELSHSPLDVAFDRGSMLVSVDNRDTTGMMNLIRLGKKGGRLVAEAAEDETSLKALNEFASPQGKLTDQELDDLLYGVADLRKRRDQEAHEGEQADVDTPTTATENI